MKNINIKEILLIIISFFAGSILMYLLINDKEEIKGTSFDKVIDSVLYIETYKNNNKSSEGTGFIYKIDSKFAYILTNEHVIIGDKIKVKNNNIEKEATLLGKDKYLDIAVLQIDKKKIKNKLELKNIKTTIGEKVYVIGNPLGEDYLGTITSGTLSGKDRLVKTEIDEETPVIMGVIQTDASINHGSSGSPLLNEKNEVIGMITMKLIDEEVEGMGFAIPTEQILRYISDLENGKEITYPKLGVKVTDVSNTSLIVSNNIEIPSIDYGVVVLEDNNSLKKGDIIIEINNKKIKDTISLKYELSNSDIDKKVSIKYLRNGKEKKANIKINSSK